MKSLSILSLFVLIAFSSIAAAQKTLLHPNTWEEYSFTEHNLRFKYPTKPEWKASRLDGGGTLNRIVQDWVLIFDLQIGTFPGNNLESDKKYLEAAVNGATAPIAKHNPKAVSNADISVDGHPGRLLVVKDDRGYDYRYKVFVVEDRVYTIMVASQDPTVISNSVYVPYVTAFLDSVHLINK
jgi:hypothetical protein